MGERGKELLRERIKNKRANDGLEEIPEDLFAKKPKYDLSAEEQMKASERRQKNKEAAEKSRRKKKEEFEKLQNENDQLHQDKCELAAMIEHLKHDKEQMLKVNQGLQYSMNQLKRWIAVRAKEFGLGKHIQNRETTVTELGSTDSGLPRGDRSPNMVSDAEDQSSKSPALPTGTETAPSSPRFDSTPPPVAESPSLIPKANSSPAHGQDFQPVGSRVRPRVLTPWLVDQNDARNGVSEVKGPVSPTAMAPQHTTQQAMGFSEVQPLRVPQGQQVVLLPKDAFVLVQGDDGQQVMMPAAELSHNSLTTPMTQPISMAAPEMQPISVAVLQEQRISTAVPQVQQIVMTIPESQKALVNTSSTRAVPDGAVRMEQPAVEMIADTATGKENADAGITSAASAIETLLKMGYKIHVEGHPNSEETKTVAVNQTHETPKDIAEPAPTGDTNTASVTISSTN